MKLFRGDGTIRVEAAGSWYAIQADGVQWDALLARADLAEALAERISALEPGPARRDERGIPLDARKPIVGQEVWASGVTYYRSRDARMTESKDAGGGSFYDRVYEAERPELFFKSTPHRTAGPGESVRIRRDSRWNVPEPELALVVAADGTITGYSIGNDMSSRDIEGENPLYLPQAKLYDRSCALGPAILVQDGPLPPSTRIEMTIRRDGASIFEGATDLSQLKREPATLVQYLFRDNSFPRGCFLLTGTGVIPPDDFTLRSADVIEITIPPIGTLINTVE